MIFHFVVLGLEGLSPSVLSQASATFHSQQLENTLVGFLPVALKGLVGMGIHELFGVIALLLTLQRLPTQRVPVIHHEVEVVIQHN